MCLIPIRRMSAIGLYYLIAGLRRTSPVDHLIWRTLWPSDLACFMTGWFGLIYDRLIWRAAVQADFKETILPTIPASALTYPRVNCKTLVYICIQKSQQNTTQQNTRYYLHRLSNQNSDHMVLDNISRPW